MLIFVTLQFKRRRLGEAEIHGRVSLGYYWVNVHIGSTHQKFKVIVDTGSKNLGMFYLMCLVAIEYYSTFQPIP